MCGSKVIPLEKGCSGKCAGKGLCGTKAHIWVLAACEGMIALFQKTEGNNLIALPQGASMVASSLQEFSHKIMQAQQEGRLQQMVLIGSPVDISWLQMLLPESANAHIVAEISYPLLPDWFRGDATLQRLASALTTVIRG